MRKTILIIFFIISIFYFPSPLPAHPHIFIDSSVTFLFRHNRLEGIRLDWTFDPVFSSSIIQDYDTDKNQRFDAAEVAAIKDEAFSSVAEYHYFSHLKVNKKIIKISRVKNFSVRIGKGKRVIYSFVISTMEKLQIPSGEVVFACYDETNFCAIEIKSMKYVSAKGIAPKKYSLSFSGDYDTPGKYFKIAAKKIVLKYKGL